MAETTTPQQQQPGLLNSILPLAVIGIGGIAIYKYLGIQEEKRKEEKSDLIREETEKTKLKIADLDSKTKKLATETFVSGKNMLGQKVNKNINNTAEALRDIFYFVNGEVIGRPIYKKKTFLSDVESKKAKMLIFEFPTQKIKSLIKWYGFLNPQFNLIKDVELTNGTDKISLVKFFEIAKQKKLF